MKIVIGVDAGGTGTRAVALDGGRVVRRGRAGPGNPATVGSAAAAAELARAVDQVVRPGDTVVGLAAGVAGISALDEDTYRARLGLRCPVRFYPDAVTAFAAGTGATSGTVLIAGTGAVAATIRDRAVGEVADGLGWLVGDEGSGVWLGLAAVRLVARSWSAWAAARSCDSRPGARSGGSPPAAPAGDPRPDARPGGSRPAAPSGGSWPGARSGGSRPAAPSGGSWPGAWSGSSRLAALVAARAAVGSVDDLVNWANRGPIGDFAALAPDICALAEDGDADAQDLVEAAAGRLVSTLDSLPPVDGPLVIAGGLLGSATAVQSAVLKRLSDRTVRIGEDPAVGAASLAAPSPN